MSQLENVYNENKQSLFSLALSITKNSSDAEDAIHDAILNISKKDLSKVSNLKAYTFMSVRNACYDKCRRRKNLVSDPESIFAEQESTDSAPEERLYIKERNSLLKKALNQLSKREKEIIMMKLYSQFTFDQISKVLNEPLATISTCYRRSLKKLKSKMKIQMALG